MCPFCLAKIVVGVICGCFLKSRVSKKECKK